MDIVVVAPGRAGGAVALAAAAAGHRIAALVTRSPVDPSLEPFPVLSYRDPPPSADLVLIAARDDAIESVASALTRQSVYPGAAVHLSGYTPVTALAALSEQGWEVGSFHPLQTLASPARGAAALAGSSVAVTAPEPLRSLLWRFAIDLDLRPFALQDSAKPRYHAAAAAASNYVTAALAVAEELFRSAGVAFEFARPLSERVVANAFELGPRSALTGPIARADWSTVGGQLAAAADVSPELGAAFAALTQATARVHRVELPPFLPGLPS